MTKQSLPPGFKARYTFEGQTYLANVTRDFMVETYVLDGSTWVPAPDQYMVGRDEVEQRAIEAALDER